MNLTKGKIDSFYFDFDNLIKTQIINMLDEIIVIDNINTKRRIIRKLNHLYLGQIYLKENKDANINHFKLPVKSGRKKLCKLEY